MKLSVVSALFTTLALVLAGFASANLEESIADRIAPVGTVCLQGEACAASVQVAAAGPRSGEDVYNTNCLACHSTGAAGAPKSRVAADWEARLANGKESLYENSINGLNAMPARGLCGTCSDDEIKAAVDYMIEGL